MATEKPVRKSSETRIWFIPAAMILGALAGVVIWLFLKLLELGIVFFWEIIPARLDFAYYPLAICATGGILIGLWRKKFGDYPDDFEEVLEVVKKTGRYSPCNISVLFASAVMPLMFGGSVGPEAGISGIIAGVCTWVGDRFKYIFKEMKELTEIGLSASLSILFRAPLFGFMAQVEGEEDNNCFPGRTKIIIYFAAILSGLGANALLVSHFGGGLHVERFGENTIEQREYIMFVPLALAGLAGGLLFHFFGKIIGVIANPLKRFPVAVSLFGGLVLGACGMILPLAIFSGETQMVEIMESWTVTAPIMLFAMGIVKLLLINVCVHSGWRGGHIIPVIFAGTCIGYGMAILTGADSVFAVATIATVMVGTVLHKPIAVILVMMIFFPFKNIIVLTLAAFIGTAIPRRKLKKFSKQASEE
ncbi:MAG: chloride channel protein [Oscillospiraceae bacterium]|nr:chloride channel protein [Oscillospiraceae bacterium]